MIGTNFFKSLDRISKKIHTVHFKLRYYPFVHLSHGAVVEEHVKVKSFSNHMTGQELKIVLKAHSLIKNNVVIQGTGIFELGRYSYVSSFSVIGVNEKIIIGDNVMIADSFSVRDTDHNFGDVDIPMRQQSYSTCPVIIQDDVWIGHGVVVTKGVRIGKGSIVSAGAVVTEDLPAFSISGGVPARVIKSRIPEQ